MKTAAVQDWPAPRNVKDVRASLGLKSYYQSYIPNFASVATPLIGLTKKDEKIMTVSRLFLCSRKLWFSCLP